MKKKKKPISPFEHKLRSFGYNHYSQYLRSDLWISKKAEYTESGLPLYCLNCKSKNYQLHHLTYDNMGNENIALDLMPLCHDCHEYLHKQMKKFGWIYLEADALHLIQNFRPAQRTTKISPHIESVLANTAVPKNNDVPKKIYGGTHYSERVNAMILEIEQMRLDEILAIAHAARRISRRIHK